jgi:hypothetical protein
MTDQNQLLREALRVARDHIDMHSLEVSHCKDAALIRAALSHPAPAQPQGVGEAVAQIESLMTDLADAVYYRDLGVIPGIRQKIISFYTTPPASQQAAQAVPTTDDILEELAQRAERNGIAGIGADDDHIVAEWLRAAKGEQ